MKHSVLLHKMLGKNTQGGDSFIPFASKTMSQNQMSHALVFNPGEYSAPPYIYVCHIRITVKNQ